jgi:hypothetical protein
MGANAPLVFKQGRMKDHGRGFSKINADWFQILSATIRVDPRLVIVLCLLFLPVSARAQTNPDDLRNKLAVGSTEEKRSALFDIRSLHTEEASRIAVPALSDKIDIVRATAVSSVIFLPHDEALRSLIPLLKDDSEFVRRETAFALGELSDPAAAAALIENLKRESSIENRSAAVIALGKIGNAQAIDPLMAILKTKPVESQGFLRGAAARAIGEIAQAIRFGKHQPTTPQNFLPDKYKKAFGESENTSLPIVFESAVPVLAKVLESSRESNDARREAAFALGAIESSDSLKPLRSCVASPEYYLAEICKEGLLKPSPK